MSTQLWHIYEVRHCTLALCSLLLASLPACHPGSDSAGLTREARMEPQAQAEAQAPPPSEDPSPALVPYTPPPTLAAPLEIRRASRTRMVYASPTRESEQRGRVPRRESFEVYAYEEAAGCKRPWAQVGEGAWLCLEHSEGDAPDPTQLPELGAGADLPFVYARRRDHRDPGAAPTPVYASARALREGEDPVAELPAYGSYAFSRRRSNHGQPVLITRDRKAADATDMRVFSASGFEGHDLLAHPLAAGDSLAWMIERRGEILVRPDPDAELLRRPAYHEELIVLASPPTPEGGGEAWLELRAGGFVRATQLAQLQLVAPPQPILGGQVTLDVDLDAQTLTLWHEDRPVFATLVSTGRAGDRTPTGLFRLKSKWAYGKMASLGSADDPYFVDAVPWAMYFTGRYAFHAAYWHNRFGRRNSHGCINLSPRDARRVFEGSTPTLPLGWLIVHEHARDPGTLVRIRQSGRRLPDRRKPLPGQEPVER